MKISVSIADTQPDALSTVTALPGYRSAAELIGRYADLSGRDVSRMPYYEAFAVFKVAVVIQQLYARYRRGSRGTRPPAAVEHAWRRHRKTGVGYKAAFLEVDIALLQKRLADFDVCT